MIGCWVWRKRSVGLREESLDEYLHWLSLKFSKLVFPSKLVLPMLLRECVLWRNEIEKPVFLPALLWNGVGRIGVSSKESHFHYLCEWRSVGQIIPNSEQKNHYAFAF